MSLLCLTLVFTSTSCSLFRSFYTRHQNEKYQRDYEFNQLKEPHYFTEYLEKNDLEGARSNGLVRLHDENELDAQFANFDAYAGYFNVNKECNSNLYTWFFKNRVIILIIILKMMKDACFLSLLLFLPLIFL